MYKNSQLPDFPEFCGFASRGQVDLIDMQYLAVDNENFKWLLTYIDHGCKLLWTAALKQKTARGVSIALLDIFSVIGAPLILQSDNGREFSGISYESRTESLQRKELDDTHSGNGREVFGKS